MPFFQFHACLEEVEAAIRAGKVAKIPNQKILGVFFYLRLNSESAPDLSQNSQPLYLVPYATVFNNAQQARKQRNIWNNERKFFQLCYNLKL